MKLRNKDYTDTCLQKTGDGFINILNGIPMSIYVVDMETFGILYMNHHMKSLYKKDLTGRTCYLSFYPEQEAACRFCTNHKLINPDGTFAAPHIREHFHPGHERWYEMQERAILWHDRRIARLTTARDITDEKRIEKELKKAKADLEQQVKKRTKDLEDMNTALEVLVKNSETERHKIEKRVLQNYESMVLPFLKELKRSLENDERIRLFHTLETNLQQIFSPFSRKLSGPMKELTPKEIQVASMIRQGLTNKEIASALNNSVRTITSHRHNIREKLGLINEKINLTSYLASL